MEDTSRFTNIVLSFLSSCLLSVTIHKTEKTSFPIRYLHLNTHVRGITSNVYIDIVAMKIYYRKNYRNKISSKMVFVQIIIKPQMISIPNLLGSYLIKLLPNGNNSYFPLFLVIKIDFYVADSNHQVHYHHSILEYFNQMMRNYLILIINFHLIFIGLGQKQVNTIISPSKPTNQNKKKKSNESKQKTSIT